MNRLLTLFLCSILCYCACTSTPPPTAGGGGIETVALVIPLPASMRSGGLLIYGDTTLVVAPGAASVTINVPKIDSINEVTWVSGLDTVVLGNGLSATADGGLPEIVLFVTGPGGPVSAADSILRRHIIKSDIIVIPVRDSLFVISDTTGMSGICLSPSVRSQWIGLDLRNAGIPLLVCNYLLLDSLGMSGPVADVDFGSRYPADSVYVNPGGPGSAGLDGPVDFFDTTVHIDWGVPPAGVFRTAVDPLDTSHAQAFCMENGQQLAGGGNLTARRCAFLFNADDAVHMTSRGAQVFRAIVRWTFLRT